MSADVEPGQACATEAAKSGVMESLSSSQVSNRGPYTPSGGWSGHSEYPGAPGGHLGSSSCSFIIVS